MITYRSAAPYVADHTERSSGLSPARGVLLGIVLGAALYAGFVALAIYVLSAAINAQNTCETRYSRDACFQILNP